MQEPPRSDPAVAFVAAAIALLVMPIVMLLGLSALGIAAGLLAGPDQRLNLSTSWLALTLFIGWVIVVGGVVLAFAARWARRLTRP